MVDYKIDYDGESGGPFTEGELLTFGGGGVAELVMLYDNGTTGEMYVSLISGSVPADDETITGGTSSATADVNDAPFVSRFPVKVRDDWSINASDDVRWTGPALGTTHSCKYDNESGGPFTVGEILSFGDGQTGELIALTDDGTTGELFIRMISGSFDSNGGLILPADNATITGGLSSATANVNGAFHVRAYTPNNLHYWFLDKGDDATFTGNDVIDRTRPRLSTRVGVTDVTLLGDANIDDAASYHLYGGSIIQGGSGSETEYNAVAIAVVDTDGATEPVIVQDNALLSATTGEYWKNAYMPTAASKIKILIKVNNAGTVIDRRVVRFRALEYGRNYFTAPDPTLSSGVTPVSLVATNDGNNNTISGTVATYTGAFAFGLATVDHNNGNGAQPYWAVGDLDTGTALQLYEKTKYDQRRGTSETIYGLNYQLFVGNDLDIPYDTESGGPFTEGETITWSGGSALLLALDDDGTAGTLYCQRLTGDSPADNTTLTGGTSSATAAVNGSTSTRLIINNWVGTFTGSAFNPANRGITLEAADATTNDLFTDLLDAQQSPPNNQSGTVNTATGNTVVIVPYDGSSVDAVGDPAFQFDILTVATALTGASVTSVVANATIPSWVPTSGQLRVTSNSGLRQLVNYTSYSGDTFTILSTDFSDDNVDVGNGLMPVGFDGVVTGGQASFTGVYTSDQGFVIKVTNGSSATPKQPSYSTAVFGSGGFSLNVNLQDD
ncbi:MAG TPA: hypothetical protein VKP88_08145 [Candidatus Paceibacterota bacterium]|nr:hypothetical protein [Candidatus Paceibacterota bacterium]